MQSNSPARAAARRTTCEKSTRPHTSLIILKTCAPFILSRKRRSFDRRSRRGVCGGRGLKCARVIPPRGAAGLLRLGAVRALRKPSMRRFFRSTVPPRQAVMMTSKGMVAATSIQNHVDSTYAFAIARRSLFTCARGGKDGR